jgi:hypothetical protein
VPVDDTPSACTPRVWALANRLYRPARLRRACVLAARKRRSWNNNGPGITYDRLIRLPKANINSASIEMPSSASTLVNVSAIPFIVSNRPKPMVVKAPKL